MATRLTREQLIDVLRTALRSAGDAPALKAGVPEQDLLALQLDVFFATPENLKLLVQEIKKGVKKNNGEVLLGSDDLKGTPTFADLLRFVTGQQVV